MLGDELAVLLLVDRLPRGALLGVVFLGQGKEGQVLGRLVDRIYHACAPFLGKDSRALVGVESRSAVVLCWLRLRRGSGLGRLERGALRGQGRGRGQLHGHRACDGACGGRRRAPDAPLVVGCGGNQALLGLENK